MADFYSINPKNSTTGQPFVTREGIILVPVWDSGFYEFGRTWLAIYRSQDGGLTWREVYSNLTASYGNHFFQGDREDEIYLCSGMGGGGFGGSVSYTPAKGLLLKSSDSGKSWGVCFKVDRPTAIYDGIAFGRTLLVSARELKSIFRSEDDCENWSEIRLGGAARSVSKIGGSIIVSSDSAIFISRDDGRTWAKRNSPIRNIVLRYPTAFRDKVLMTGVGWRSLILATDLEGNRWGVAFDVTKAVPKSLMARLAIAGDYLFVGDELKTGALLRIDTRFLRCKHVFPYAILSHVSKLIGILKI